MDKMDIKNIYIISQFLSNGKFPSTLPTLLADRKQLISKLKKIVYEKLCGKPLEESNDKCFKNEKNIDSILENQDNNIYLSILGKNILNLFNPNIHNLDDPDFLDRFSKILEIAIYPVISCIYYPQLYIQDFIAKLNKKILRDNYAILKCNPTTPLTGSEYQSKDGINYNCGRFVTINVEEGKNTRIIFTNTVSTEDDSPDVNYYTENIQPNLKGGYYQKYLKYKKKYLQLKDSLNK